MKCHLHKVTKLGFCYMNPWFAWLCSFLRCIYQVSQKNYGVFAKFIDAILFGSLLLEAFIASKKDEWDREIFMVKIIDFPFHYTQFCENHVSQLPSIWFMFMHMCASKPRQTHCFSTKRKTRHALCCNRKGKTIVVYLVASGYYSFVWHC